jgi:hypothetical protein
MKQRADVDAQAQGSGGGDAVTCVGLASDRVDGSERRAEEAGCRGRAASFGAVLLLLLLLLPPLPLPPPWPPLLLLLLLLLLPLPLV